MILYHLLKYASILCIIRGNLRAEGDLFMNKLKDILHNINDVLLAIVIIAAAAGIIWWRLNVILDYPKQLSSSQSSVETVQEDN